ncbi:MAG: hypothetical protein WDZ76_12745 [Pseudohongiellaceae bacterium]
MKIRIRVLLALLGCWPLFVTADQAILVDEAVLVATKAGQQDPQDENGESTSAPPLGDAVDASYVTSGGWAVTSPEYVDAASMLFDFGATASVAVATLTLPIEAVFPQNGAAPVELYSFADDGELTRFDFSTGIGAPIAEVDALALGQIVVDVTGPVNAALKSSQYVGFRVKSAVAAEAVQASLPVYTGVKFNPAYHLEFTPGAAPAPGDASSLFDGFTLVTPNVEIQDIGTVLAKMELIDPNKGLFRLTQATITAAPEPVSGPALSGLALMDCNAFEAPGGVVEGSTGIPTFSFASEILDIPETTFLGSKYSAKLRLLDEAHGIFQLLTLEPFESGPTSAAGSIIGGGLTMEPTQDFIPLCHGWVLIGDTLRNRVVERNVISGETGATYAFNASPEQFTLDAANGLAYMTVHPNSQRLYKLNLANGDITWNSIRQTLGSRDYSWQARDIALGENGNLFLLLYDQVLLDPQDEVTPFTDTGLWVGYFDGNANPLLDTIPLEEPVRVEYDPVQQHMFLATESNLATFDFDPATTSLDFVEGTDVPVGSSCTDFSISPDGSRLAYSCPQGNQEQEDFSIVDMAPDDYFNIDGEWYLGSSPVSATFNNAGDLLLAVDNEKLFVFDVVTHLLIQDYELGLGEDEVISKVRISRDGEFALILVHNEVHTDFSRMYWVPMPDYSGTPL